MKFKVPKGKVISALGLAIDRGSVNNSNYLQQIMNQVYLGVWNTDVLGGQNWLTLLRLNYRQEPGQWLGDSIP